MIKHKNILKRLALIPSVSIFCILTGLISGSQAFATSRISLSPNPFALNVGSSQAVTVTLDEPIICEDPYLPCNLGLIFTSSDPANTTITPSSLSFSASSWYVPQQITVTSLNNGQYGNENITISSTAISASEYYKNFQVSLGVTVNNTNEPPAPADNQTISVSSNTKQNVSRTGPLAPDTGYGVPTSNASSTLPIFLIASGLIIISVVTRRLFKVVDR